VNGNDLWSAYEAQALDPAHPVHWSGPAEMVDRIAERMQTAPTDLVLDVGCGVGGPARRLARLVGCSVVAVDRLPAVVREARRRTKAPSARPGTVRFAVARAERLPVATGSVDQVWCLGVVAHVEDRPAFAREAARVVRPGGTMAVTEGFATGRRPPRFPGAVPMPWAAVSAVRVAAELREAGFVDVTVERWPGAVEHADLGDGMVLPAMIVARTEGSGLPARRYSAGSTGPP
jgi:SAM-dependent methyltransferase